MLNKADLPRTHIKTLLCRPLQFHLPRTRCLTNFLAYDNIYMMEAKIDYVKAILSRTGYTPEAGKYQMMLRDLMKLSKPTLYVLSLLR